MNWHIRRSCEELEEDEQRVMEPIRRALEPWFAAHARPVWRPVIAGPLSSAVKSLRRRWSDKSTPPFSSAFGGGACLKAGESWPTCGECRKPLHIMLQLDLTQLPSELGLRFGRGLLQVFHCITDGCLVESWVPFGDGKVVRVLSDDDLTNGEYLVATEIEPFPLKRIVGWSRFLDVPDPAEHDEHGLIHTYTQGGLRPQPKRTVRSRS